MPPKLYFKMAAVLRRVIEYVILKYMQLVDLSAVLNLKSCSWLIGSSADFYLRESLEFLSCFNQEPTEGISPRTPVCQRSLLLFHQFLTVLSAQSATF